MSAQIKVTWKDDGRWRKKSLAKMYNSVKSLFGFYERNGIIRKRKQLKKLLRDVLLEYT